MQCKLYCTWCHELPVKLASVYTSGIDTCGPQWVNHTNCTGAGMWRSCCFSGEMAHVINDLSVFLKELTYIKMPLVCRLRWKTAKRLVVCRLFNLQSFMWQYIINFCRLFQMFHKHSYYKTCWWAITDKLNSVPILRTTEIAHCTHCNRFNTVKLSGKVSVCRVLDEGLKSRCSAV